MLDDFLDWWMTGGNAERVLIALAVFPSSRLWPRSHGSGHADDTRTQP